MASPSSCTITFNNFLHQDVMLTILFENQYDIFVRLLDEDPKNHCLFEGNLYQIRNEAPKFTIDV